MQNDRLYQLGLFVRRSPSGVEADLSLEGVELHNPLMQRRLTEATFTVVGERLRVVDPPELVGLPPLRITDFDTAGQLRTWLAAEFRRTLAELERRSAELRLLGARPHVDPESLQLSAIVEEGADHFELAADRHGNFRLAQVIRDGRTLPLTGLQTLDLSSFRDRFEFVRGLERLVNAGLQSEPEAAPTRAPPFDGLAPPKARSDGRLGLSEVAAAFGAQALIPPGGGLEVLVEARARGQTYRFAAARLDGRTFRGLLAGPGGKVWSDKFDLGGFEGVKALCARVLGIGEHEIDIDG